MRARHLCFSGIVLAGQLAAVAHAQDLLPTRTGESGFIDVPVAEPLGRAGASFRLDVRAIESMDVGRAIGPSPFTMSLGLGRVEAGFSLRQGGLPGDPRPSATIPAGAVKVGLFEGRTHLPALSADLLLDRINRTPAVHVRAVATTERRWRLQLTGFGGYVVDSDRTSGWTAGGALSLLGPRRSEIAVELLRNPAGALAAAELRWRVLPSFGVGLNVGYLPSDAKTKLAGFSVFFLSPAVPKPVKAIEAEKKQEEGPQAKANKRVFSGERPRYPLKLRERTNPESDDGPAPHYSGRPVVPAGVQPAVVAPAAAALEPPPISAKGSAPAAGGPDAGAAGASEPAQPDGGTR